MGGGEKIQGDRGFLGYLMGAYPPLRLSCRLPEDLQSDFTADGGPNIVLCVGLSLLLLHRLSHVSLVSHSTQSLLHACQFH